MRKSLQIAVLFPAALVVAAGTLLARPAVAQDELAGTGFAAAELLGTGMASWYGTQFAGKPTASGERFNPKDYTAAHRDLPFGSRVRVTNLANGTSVIVRVNDRGPFHKSRLIDVSKAAARDIGLTRSGTAQVQLELLGESPAPVTDTIDVLETITP